MHTLFPCFISGVGHKIKLIISNNLLETDQYFVCNRSILSVKIVWFVLVSFLADLNLVLSDCNWAWW
jgi:hypothetical protein